MSSNTTDLKIAGGWFSIQDTSVAANRICVKCEVGENLITIGND